MGKGRLSEGMLLKRLPTPIVAACGIYMKAQPVCLWGLARCCGSTWPCSGVRLQAVQALGGLLCC